MQTSLSLPTPAHFDYITTVDSHGWRDLAPFRYDKEAQILFRRHRLADGTPIDWQITSTPDSLHIVIESKNPLSEAACAEIEQALTRSVMLRQVMDAQVFGRHAAMKSHGGNGSQAGNAGARTANRQCISTAQLPKPPRK